MGEDLRFGAIADLNKDLFAVDNFDVVGRFRHRTLHG